LGDAAIAQLCELPHLALSLQRLYLSKPLTCAQLQVPLAAIESNQLPCSPIITDRGLMPLHRLHALRELSLENCHHITDRGIESLIVLTDESQSLASNIGNQYQELQRTLSPSQSLIRQERQRKLREQTKNLSYLTTLAQRLRTLNLCNVPITAISLTKVWSRHARA
jgi:hypothetical protein